MPAFSYLPSVSACMARTPWKPGRAGCLPATVLSLLTREKTGRGGRDPRLRFVGRARLEGMLMIGTLLCVALLLSQMPPRHLSRMPSHTTHVHGMAH